MGLNLANNIPDLNYEFPKHTSHPISRKLLIASYLLKRGGYTALAEDLNRLGMDIQINSIPNINK
jgi:hypothetical protein